MTLLDLFGSVCSRCKLMFDGGHTVQGVVNPYEDFQGL